MIERKELRDKLPYGYQKNVAERAGVSISCVSNYLKGLNNSEKVEMAILEILAELSDRKKALLDRII